jgi:hypothetical protein
MSLSIWVHVDRDPSEIFAVIEAITPLEGHKKRTIMIRTFHRTKGASYRGWCSYITLFGFVTLNRSTAYSSWNQQGDMEFDE